MTTFTVTTPIYYANAQPHIGHAYTTIAADVLARHARQQGRPTFSLTGTDEHGEPIARAAAAQGVSPQALVDASTERFRALLGVLHAEPDFFVRTTSAEHRRQVGELLGQLRERGLIYKAGYDGQYCPRCADFKSGREAADGRCADHDLALEAHCEENWFFRLSAFSTQLAEHLERNADWIVPASRHNEARALVAAGLQDVSISRATLTWGVTVPWDPDQVFYVWFDALLNYLTAPTSAGRPDAWPAAVQLIGKDILKFHAIFWPAVLWALGRPLPERLVVHGHLLVDGRKASKSRGNVIDPFAVAAEVGADALRVALLRDVPWLGDGSLSSASTFTRSRDELADVYGNLVRRVSSLVVRHRSALAPACAVPAPVLAALDGVDDRVGQALGRAALGEALEHAWAAARALNGVVDLLAPWKLARDNDQVALDAALGGLLEGVRAVSVLLHPFAPDGTARTLKALHASASWTEARARAHVSARPVDELAPLYPKRPSGRQVQDPA